MGVLISLSNVLKKHLPNKSTVDIALSIIEKNGIDAINEIFERQDLRKRGSIAQQG